MTFTYEPLISSTLWLTLSALSAVMLGGYAWRKPKWIGMVRWGSIITLMGLGLSAILFILLNPTWQERIPPPAGKARLVILVDESASMGARDMPDGRSRFQSAVDIAEACASKLAERFELQIGTFSNHVLPVGVEELPKRIPSGTVTDLATALTSSIEPGHAIGQQIFLLSDGNHNAPGGTARVLASVAFARATNTSVFTKTFGTDATIHDLAVRLQSPQQLSFIGQTIPVTMMIRRRGRAPEAVVAVLTHEGKEIERRQILVSGDSEAEVQFQVEQSKRGLYRYELRVEAFDGEVTTVNNYATFLLRVVDEPIRVLLVEGKPYWDSKFLARTLSSDPSIELVSVVRMTEGRFLERTLKRIQQDGDKKSPGDDAEETPDLKTIAAIPVTESWRILAAGAAVLEDAKALSSFQVLVLGRDAEVFLSDQALLNLKSWISSDSGALVCYRGQPMAQVNERLEKLLPVNWRNSRESRFRMTLTDRGRDLRWMELRGAGSGDALPFLPTLATTATAEDPKPLATVLATVSGGGGDESPVVTYQPYGGGKVVVVEGAGMWRWAFLPPAYADHDATYSGLWQSLLRWLVSRAGLLPGQDLAIRTDQVTFGTDEVASATLLIRKEALHSQVPTVELTGPGIVENRSIVPVASGEDPGVFRVVFGNLPEGRYQAAISGQSPEKAGSKIVFDVRTLMEEQLDLKARPDLMARIGVSTGGIELLSNDPAEIAASLVKQIEKSRPDRIRRTTAWDRWWVLSGILLLWTVAWGLRRNAGLV